MYLLRKSVNLSAHSIPARRGRAMNEIVLVIDCRY